MGDINRYRMPGAALDFVKYLKKRLANEFLSAKERSEYTRLLNKEKREIVNEQKK